MSQQVDESINSFSLLSNQEYILNEMDMSKCMCVSLYLRKHPFVKKDIEYKMAYLEKLKFFVDKYCASDIFSVALLRNYQELFLNEEKFYEYKLPSFWDSHEYSYMKRKRLVNRSKKSQLLLFCYIFTIDCLFLCAFFDEKKGKKILKDIEAQFGNYQCNNLQKLFEVLYHEKPICNDMWMVADLIYCWRRNTSFLNTPVLRVMVTANMSAGKSTFINALVGKNISLSQTLACTSKIHSIVGKAYDDGYEYEYDHDLVLDAGKEELLNDNELNRSDRIMVGTYYNSALGGSRLIIDDTPGVNYYGNSEHTQISHKWINKREFKLLIYIMDATQLGTIDDARHLEFVKGYIKNKKILFIMNKIDAFNPEEEDMRDIIERQRKYLEEIGFRNPSLCPVSSRAACLVQKYRDGKLGRAEWREFYNLVDKFEQMNLKEYYDKYFPEIRILDVEVEEEQLFKNCGIAYIEQIILRIYNGGKIYGTSFC